MRVCLYAWVQAKVAGGDALSVEMAIAKKTLPNSRLREAPIHHLNLTQVRDTPPQPHPASWSK